jgi:hypothetical protein
MKIVSDGEVELDATFFVEKSRLSLVIESAGGKSGVNSRNREYSDGLKTILRRLAQIGAVITEIRVESSLTVKLPLSQQRITLGTYRLPLALREVENTDDLKKDISVASRKPGAKPGSSSGGSSRRLRIFVDVAGYDEAALESFLSTGKPFIA